MTRGQNNSPNILWDSQNSTRGHFEKPLECMFQKKLESYQNIIPNGYDKSNIENYPKHLPNYYREYRQPKIANQVS
jgi:hypothetical protein